MIRLFIIAMAVMLGAIAGVVLFEIRHGARKKVPKPEYRYGDTAWQVAYLNALYELEAPRSPR